MSHGGAHVVRLEDVAPVQLRDDSWSRVLLTDKTVGHNDSCLGYSVFGPGFTSADLSHSTEELCLVVSGHATIRLEDGEVAVGAREALYVPAKAWHTVVNDGDEDLVMVFSFPSPDYPPTERRDPRQ
jgi:mannose-6-phosphate isomerase-like protein (cupin superfamily)